MENAGAQRRSVLLLAVLFEGGLGGLAVLLGWLLGEPPLWQHIHWDASGAGWGLAASVPPLLLFFLCLYWTPPPLARIKQFCIEVIRPLFASCSVFDLALVSLLA